jgi:hypothetical protein
MSHCGQGGGGGWGGVTDGGGIKGRRGWGEGGGGERGEEDRGISLQPNSTVPAPAKEVSFLYAWPFMFSKCALLLHLPYRSRFSGGPRRRCATLNGP